MSNIPEKLIPTQDLQLCVICARGFTLDRIEVHEQICRKSSWCTRKSFDISQQRIKGMVAENLSKAHIKADALDKVHENRSSALSTNWRLKREDFIQSIKDAKELTENKSSLKLNDLSVPLTTNDYVQCPHCLRQFNQSSAERHINICARMTYHTPKSIIGLSGNTNPNPKTSQAGIANK